MTRKHQDLVQQIIHVGQQLYHRGFVAANDGNISARINEEQVLITPTGISKGFMQPDDFVIIDMAGKKIAGNKKPSSEYRLHLKIYRERPDVHSVCHAHPPYVTAFAVSGINFDFSILPEVIIALGEIPLVKYAPPGSATLLENLKPFLKDCTAFVLQNHGAMTIGKDVQSAHYRMETLEHFAHIFYLAKNLGKVNYLSQNEVKTLLNLRDRFNY